MDKNIEYEGIKCDNPNCDYHDNSVKQENYFDWVNKPCPQCGENLLTEEHYNRIKMVDKFFNNSNIEFPNLDPEIEAEIISDMEANGVTPDMLVDILGSITEDELELIFKAMRNGIDNNIHM